MVHEPSKQSVILSTGIRMAYVEAGKPGGPVVLLLHGYTDTSRSYFPTLQALHEAGTDLHVFALDLRGHGGSSMPAGPACASAPEQCFGPPALAADVLAFMAHKGILKAHIVGHSNGSLVAQELALSQPKRVLSLVLIGSWACSVAHPAIEEFLLPLVEGQWKRALERLRPGLRWPEDAYHLTPMDADPGARAWIAQNWALEIAADPEFVRKVVPETAAVPLGAWIGVLRSLTRLDHRERLRQLSVPALVIWATQDNFFVEENQAELRAALDAAVASGCTRYVFKTYGRAPLPESGQQESDLGHNTQWGAPHMVAADLMAWVKTGRPTADLPFCDPADPRRVVVERGAARLIEKRPARIATGP